MESKEPLSLYELAVNAGFTGTPEEFLAAVAADNGNIDSEVSVTDGLFENFPDLIDIEKPEFEKAGRVHDWRRYVPDDWQKKWFEFTVRERQIIAIMAENQASNEDWD